MNTGGTRRWIAWPLGLLIVGLVIARFTLLSTTPNGFFVDEAAIATQVICVAQTHADFQGNAWPLYSSVLAGGHASAPLLYPAALWTQAFGISESALRAFAGFHGLLLTVAIATAVGLAVRNWLAGALSLLLGLSSPWLFALSRVFWDPIVGASWFAVALSAYWLARRTGLSWQRAACLWSLAGIAAAVAAYAYPPVRIQLLFSGALILVLDWRRLLNPYALLGVAWLTLLCLPLAQMYLTDPSFSERGSMLAIWNADWLISQNFRLEDVPAIFAKNFFAHFDPDYLFWHGDINLRHTTGYGGIIGPTEALAVLLILGLAPRFVCSRQGLLLLGLYVAALLPAALTRDYIPHALRSLGGIGPLLLFAGLGIAHLLQHGTVLRQRIVVCLLMLTATIWAASFGRDYFQAYHERSRLYFHTEGTPDQLPPSTELARHYYLSRLGQPLNCPGPQ